jgi:NADH:ubiquinone oxidoreductase subunit 3 (subunit A)
MIQLENLIVVLPIGLCAIGLTIYLVLSSKRDDTDKSLTFNCDSIHIFSKQVNLILIAYLLLVILTAIIGLLSNFLVPSIVGFICAVIPAFLLVVAKRTYGGD